MTEQDSGTPTHELQPDADAAAPDEATWLIPIPIGYGLILYWQKRDHFNLLSADRATYRPDTVADDHEVQT